MPKAKPAAKSGNMFTAIRRVVARIPKGKVASYGQVAEIAGFPGAARQVAWALHNNSRGIPWHRVLGAGGAIRLPGEPGLEQRLRLRSEGVVFRGDRVDLAKSGWRIS
jgi:methylated-DNA-protein-cysteine methyltransferase-like protein